MSNKATFVANVERINQIGINQTRVNVLKDQTGEMTAESQTLKLDSYAHLIAGIAPAKLTTKSNLNGKDRVTLKADLEGRGNQTPSMADKMIKNAVGARNVFGIGGDNWNPAAVLEVFKDNKITSEAKLVKAVSGDDKKGIIDVLTQKIVGRRSTKKNDKGERIDGDKWLDGSLDNYSKEAGIDFDEALAELQQAIANAVRLRSDMASNAQAAGDQTQQDNDDVDEMMKAL